MRRILIDELYCKGCHLCISQCAQKVLKVSGNRSMKGYLQPQASKPEDCTGCLMCELICPDMAITLESTEDEE